MRRAEVSLGSGGSEATRSFARSARPAIGPVAVTTAPKRAQRARRRERQRASSRTGAEARRGRQAANRVLFVAGEHRSGGRGRRQVGTASGVGGRWLSSA